MSLTKEQFTKNSLWTFAELSLYPVLMIIATPVFINRLGIEQYGLWMLVNVITLSMNVLNIGVGDSTIRLISIYRVDNNSAAIKKIFHFNFSLSLALCVFVSCLGFIFWKFNFITLFYKGDSVGFAGKILLFACLSAGFRFVEVFLLSVFKAFERFDINSRLIMISKNSVLLAGLGLVIFGQGLITVFICMVIINFINLIIQLLALNKFRPGILSFPSLIFLKEKPEHANYHLWYWLQSAIALFGFLADKFIITLVADVTTLGYYSIATLIGSQIHNFFLSFGSFAFPRVSYKMAANANITPLYYIARSLIALPGWSIIFILLFFGETIFKIWLGTETYLHSIYFIKLYLVFEAAMLLIIVPFYFINGTRSVRLNSAFEALLRTGHLLAMLIGFYSGGINGILYGLIVSTFIIIPVQYYIFHKKILVDHLNMQFIWILAPVFCLLGLVLSGGIMIQLAFIVCLLLSCKLIYFDPTKQYAARFLSSVTFSKS